MLEMMAVHVALVQDELVVHTPCCYKGVSTLQCRATKACLHFCAVQQRLVYTSVPCNKGLSTLQCCAAKACLHCSAVHSVLVLISYYCKLYVQGHAARAWHVQHL